MDRSQFAGIVDLSKPALVQLLVDLSAQMAAVGKAQDAAGEGKFTGELKGGLIDESYKGVTGVCGEPDADIEKGMREEHTKCPDSDRFRRPIMVWRQRRPRSGSSCSRAAAGVPRWRGRRTALS
jgi:hypothetical protein